MIPPAAGPQVPEDLVLIGKLGTVHGIHGELRLFSLSDVPGRFENLQSVWWVDGRGRTQQLRVRTLRAAGNEYRISFEGLESREEAARLINGFIALPRDQRGRPPAGGYFLDDIIGLDVFDESGRRLGTVAEIYQTGAHDIYAVRDQGRELLLPALRAVILQVDIPAHRMTVRPPKGLEEA